MLNAILTSQCHAFIGGPPITTLSVGMLFFNSGLFIISFLISIIFQGWYVSFRHTGIKFSDSTLQAFFLKFAFLFYAFPVLLLSDLCGGLPFLLFERVPILKGAVNNPWFFGIFYYLFGLIFITYIVSKFEFYLFSNKLPNQEKMRFRRTVIIYNALIFTVALLLTVLNVEFMT